MMAELLEEYKSDYEYIKHRIMAATESERYDADSKQSTAYFEEAANTTVNSGSVIPQQKSWG